MIPDPLPRFPELVAVVPAPLPEPCLYPYFLLAYMRGRGWTLRKAEMYTENSPRMQAMIKEWQSNGWTVYVLRLPPGGPWGHAYQ